MSERLSAAGIHLLTATGAAFALLALVAASRGDWQWMFVWLGVALIVDTVDGPLARASAWSKCCRASSANVSI